MFLWLDKISIRTQVFRLRTAIAQPHYMILISFSLYMGRTNFDVITGRLQINFISREFTVM